MSLQGKNISDNGLRWRQNFLRESGAKHGPHESDDDFFETEVNEQLDSRGILEFIEGNIIGRNAVFEGPFGPRNILYCDYVASGKALKCIEQFMLRHVLPMYANTHTTTTVTSSQTTSLRKEAKDIIRRALGTTDDDVVLFAGSGVTGAVHKLIAVLDLQQPPVVFCGPFEHHSNLLPWREIGSHVINISETVSGNVNLKHLDIALRMWCHSGRQLIGAFSAASNVTGVTTDTKAVSAMLHKYGAISLWDYATGGPYMDIEMHPEPVGGYDASKDAVFISMHKFVGSPDAPGLLVASKKLFRNAVPSGCGGGTVLYVSENDHRYLKDIESREEGGTPAIIGSIRAGLAFKLKMSVGCDTIMKREDELYKRAINVWKDIPELEILGRQETNTGPQNDEHKLAVFSFLVRHMETRYYLHYNFVASLLNDVFGIQSRGGCACAGVYAQHLLSIDRKAEKRFGGALVEDPKNTRKNPGHESERTVNEILRPGFTRLNFPYFLSDEDADYIINAVAMVAKHGWTLLSQYQYSPRSGEWNHIDHLKELDDKRLEDVTFDSKGLHFPEDYQRHQAANTLPTSRIDCLKKAERIFFNARKVVGKPVEDQRQRFAEPKVRGLRWFLLPCEAQWILKGKKVEKKTNMIFEVRTKIQQLSVEEIKDACAVNGGTGGPKTITDFENNNKNAKDGFIIHNGGNDAIGPTPDETQNKKKRKALATFLKALTCRNKNAVQVV